jgi:hypothetical protein
VAIKTFLLSFAALILGLWPQGASAAAQTPALATDHTPRKFTVSQPVHIPGLMLKPGAYSIHVVDHLWERYIVHIDGPEAGVHLTFLAVENTAIPKSTESGKIDWDHAVGGATYVRGWVFPGVPGVLEFVYPKTEAVAIAQSNAAKVPAIDPVSEGRPGNLADLSKVDREEITLWLLTQTHVGPGDTASGIQAERYPMVASARRKSSVARLPQTASNLPLIVMLGMFSLVAAISVRIYRCARVTGLMGNLSEEKQS